MNRLLYLLFVFAFFHEVSFSQSCLPEGITFTTQAQIDSFQINYPGCTEIEGDMSIGGYWGSSNITNLNGLSVLTSIWGFLNIENNDSLSNLMGIESLSYIGGNLSILHNEALTSLEGLEGLTSIGGDLQIDLNNSLTSISGLQDLNAASILNLTIMRNASLNTCDVGAICDYLADPNGTVIIYSNASGCNHPHEIAQECGFTMPCLPYGNYYFNNQAEIDSFQFNYPGCKELEGDVHIGGDISNLNGLNVITSIGGDVLISGGLTSLTGLEGLTSIRGDLQFVNNHALTSMAGLEGLIFIEGSLFIGRKYHGGNDALISLTGLSGLTAIGEYLCIYDNDSLATLTGIEGLTSIGGSFHISENNALISMTGLQGLTSIGGFLEIWPNRSLNSLTGLQGLTSIGSYFSIWGPNDLTNLTGLENLTSIGGHIDISFNDALTSLEGLESLTSIGGYISITGNALTSLTGMDNIDAASITGISIDWNWTLSKCDIESICEYLANPNGSINIKDNATGCDSPEEVQDSCEANAVSIKERYIINNCMSSPNPCNGETTFFLSLDEPTHFKLVIMDRLGRVVATVMNKSLAIGTHRIKWNASGLSSGIYFYRLITGNQSSTGKLVVVR